MQFIDSFLQNQLENNALRTLNEKQNLIDFSSNDFLGLASNEHLHKKIIEKTKGLTKFGSTGSRLLTGNNPNIVNLERFLSTLFHSESSLIFPSGYQANIGLLSAVASKNDTILLDENIHTSLKDGARLSLAQKFVFKHNNILDLERLVKNSKGNCFIVIESLYSMDGDFAPIQQIVELTKLHRNTYIIVDEAHTTGLFGESCSGYCHYLGVEKDVFARIFTFGKALGSSGACISGDSKLILFLINKSRAFIYSTAPSLLNIVSIKEGFNYILNHPEIIKNLFQNIEFFSNQVGDISKSYIYPYMINGNKNAKLKSLQIQENGFDVRPILYPTVKKNSERLRICIHSFNTKKELKHLSELLKQSII